MARPASTAFDKEIRSQVAANLNTLLRRRGWTKADLAKQSQISPSTLSGYFNEKYNITPGNLQILSDVFGVEKGDIDPRYKIDTREVHLLLRKRYDNISRRNAASRASTFLSKHNCSSNELTGATSTSAMLRILAQEADELDADRISFTSQNSLANRKVNISKPDSDLNPEEQLDKFTLQAEANTASILLEKYIETANQLLSIRNKINPSEDLQHFLTVIAGTITVAEDIKREYSEILMKTEQE
jgi:transcriptional regulator with XRE-family HTH domain